MKKELITLILLSVTLGAMAQLLLKTGMNKVGEIKFGLEMINAAFNPYVLTGLLTYFISALSWVMVLSRADVSYAYPIGSLGYVIVAFLGWSVLGESVNLMRIMGIIVIIIGVYIVGKSK